MGKEATIKDVAKYAGVSISTVSRALNNLDRVSEKTRAQVLEAAQSLHFVPNGIAVSMVRKSTRMAAVMVPDLDNAAYLSIGSAVERAMGDAGYHTLFVSSGGRSGAELASFAGSIGKFVDGVILVPSCPDGEICRAFRRPIVVVDRLRPEWGLDSVDMDNYGGVSMLTKLLLDHGHTRIGLLTGKARFSAGADRLRGFLDAMAAAGLSAAEEDIFQGGWTEATGAEGVDYFLARESRPTALIACGSLICAGAIQALYRRRVAIPEELSLVGFGQNPLTEFVRPRITVARQPLAELGAAAAARLIELLRPTEEGAPARRITLPVELVPGESVKKLN